MTTRYLVRFDADKIKEYVFATGRLKEIRGASALVRDLTDMPLDRLKQEGWIPANNPELLFAGGASGALLFDDQADASEFCRRLERLYRRETGVATLSAIVQEYEAGDPEKEARAREAAERSLANRKASRPNAEALPSGGMIRFCASDRLYPASRKVQSPGGGDPQLLSAGSAAKYRESRKSRRSFFEEDAPFWMAFAPLTGGDAVAWQAAGRWSASNDIDMISRESTPEGYIAFVYADGDGIGATIRKVAQNAGLKGYANYSNTLSMAAAASAAYAIHVAYPRLPQSGTLPFELITIGGDDVMLLCTAEQGLRLAVALSEAFQTEMMERAPEYPATASVGVVIAHGSHPIVNLRERAGELLKSAKKAAVDGHGGIDFHIVSTPSLAPLDAVRREGYRPTSGSGVLRFTDRPYSRERMGLLLNHAARLRELPGSKRVQLYEACMRAEDRTNATLNVLQVQARMALTDRMLLMNALYELDVAELYPFIKRQEQGREVYTTPLIDLLEAAEFVPGK